MNPPFDHGADIRNIEQARSKLKLGGRLVANCANGPRQREVRFNRIRVNQTASQFIKKQGTNVRAAIVGIHFEDGAGLG